MAVCVCVLSAWIRRWEMRFEMRESPGTHKQSVCLEERHAQSKESNHEDERRQGAFCSRIPRKGRRRVRPVSRRTRRLGCLCCSRSSLQDCARSTAVECEPSWRFCSVFPVPALSSCVVFGSFFGSFLASGFFDCAVHAKLQSSSLRGFCYGFLRRRHRRGRGRLDRDPVTGEGGRVL